MSTATLADTLFTRTRRSVFRELFAAQDGLHLRELERRTGVNGRHLVRELHALRDSGILTTQRAGNVVSYRFNPRCPIYEEIQAIIRKTVGLADVLRETLAPFSGQVEFAYVFGSFAAGEQRTDSDVDLMVVGTITLRKLSPLLRDVAQAIRREVNPILYTPEEYQEALEDAESFVSRIDAGPRIDLIGGSGNDTG